MCKQPNHLFDGAVVVAAAGLFAVLSTVLDERLQIAGGRYNFPVVPLILAGIVVLTPRASIIVHVLELRPIERIGVISYAHLPVSPAHLEANRQVRFADWTQYDRAYLAVCDLRFGDHGDRRRLIIPVAGAAPGKVPAKSRPAIETVTA